MTVTARKYTPVCEQPGCDRRLTVPRRTMWSDPGDYELDALRTYWQHDGGGRWYCPKHWHLTCHYCGATAVGLPTGWPTPAGRPASGPGTPARFARGRIDTTNRKGDTMGMHEFHVTTYVLTCDECGTRYGGFGEYLDIPDLYQHAISAGWQADDDHHYYCPEHWQFNCQTCGRRYSRPNPDTKEGARWVETHGRDCPECIRKKNLAKFEEQAKKLEE